jgi:hypothetical protein
MPYTCDSGIWHNSITGIAPVVLRCKFIQACGLRINPSQGFIRFAAERYMHYTSDTVAQHATITGIAESYKGE